MGNTQTRKHKKHLANIGLPRESMDLPQSPRRDSDMCLTTSTSNSDISTGVPSSPSTPKRDCKVLVSVEEGFRGRFRPKDFVKSVHNRLNEKEKASVCLLFPEQFKDCTNIVEICENNQWSLVTFKGTWENKDRLAEEYIAIMQQYHIRKLLIVAKNNPDTALHTDVVHEADSLGIILCVYCPGNLRRSTSMYNALKTLGVPAHTRLDSNGN